MTKEAIREPILTKPDYFTKIDPNIFREIEDVFSETTYPSAGFTLYEGTINMDRPVHKKLASIVASLTNEFNTYFADSGITTISYSFDAKPIKPGRSQRGTRWHYDKDSTSQSLAVVASSNLPTEFLVAKDQSEHGIKSGLRYVCRMDEKSNGFQNIPIEAGLARGALCLYHPAPLDAVIMTDNVHRSPTNETDKEQPRIWLRAAFE